VANHKSNRLLAIYSSGKTTKIPLHLVKTAWQGNKQARCTLWKQCLFADASVVDSDWWPH
jgi:hypothetical protein